MSSQLDELFVSYEPIEDRILLRMKTVAGDEARAWLTRRVLPVVWKALERIVESDPSVQSQASVRGREALIDFSREQALARAEYRTEYQDAPAERQMFPRPLLVSEVKLEQAADGVPRLALQDTAGARLDMQVGTGLAHTWCKLLGDAAAAAGWQLELPRPGVAAAPARPNKPGPGPGRPGTVLSGNRPIAGGQNPSRESRSAKPLPGPTRGAQAGWLHGVGKGLDSCIYGVIVHYNTRWTRR